MFIGGSELPPLGDIRAGIAIVARRLEPVDRATATQCLSKLLVGFNERKTGAEAKLLLEVWMEACGFIPADLWVYGTGELLRTHTYGMPKPSNLMEAVSDVLEERTGLRRRLRALFDRASNASAPFQPEPLEVRIRTMRDSFRRIGNVVKAQQYENELAALERRAPDTLA
jgi:hypothetical protein